MPKGFVNEETGKDFAEEAGDLKQVNLEKAKTLWAEGLKELGQTEGKLEILGSDTDNVKKISEYLQGALSETLEGLTVTVSSVPFQNRLELSGKGEFDAVIGGWTPVYADPVDFLNLFLGSNSNNYGQWDNAEYNELIKESGTTYATDGEKRWETLIKADQLLAEEVPVSPLYQITEVYLINQQLSNMELGPLGSPYFKPVKVGK